MLQCSWNWKYFIAKFVLDRIWCIRILLNIANDWKPEVGQNYIESWWKIFICSECEDLLVGVIWDLCLCNSDEETPFLAYIPNTIQSNPIFKLIHKATILSKRIYRLGVRTNEITATTTTEKESRIKLERRNFPKAWSFQLSHITQNADNLCSGHFLWGAEKTD